MEQDEEEDQEYVSALLVLSYFYQSDRGLRNKRGVRLTRGKRGLHQSLVLADPPTLIGHLPTTARLKTPSGATGDLRKTARQGTCRQQPG